MKKQNLYLVFKKKSFKKHYHKKNNLKEFMIKINKDFKKLLN